MAKSYAKHISKKVTSQSQPIPGSGQVQNSAGGFTWAVDNWTQLDRFLILGAAGGSYYASEQKLTSENAAVINACIAEDGLRTVARIAQISESGRAPKNDPAVFALAVCSSTAQDEVRAAALLALPLVCRIGTHLFQFAEELKQLRTYGSGVRRAFREWYLRRDLKSMCFQLVKYQKRNSWAHGDVFRLIHIRPGETTPSTPEQLLAVQWACQRDTKLEPEQFKDLPYIGAFEEAKTATPERLIQLIEEAGLTWEMLPTESLKSPKVWEALLHNNLPLTALTRNLGRMSAIGLFSHGLLAPSSATKKVVDLLGDVEHLRKSRLHPLSLLVALMTYRSGHGLKGSLRWTASQPIVDALDRAFYDAFGNVESTGKNFLLGLDVSGSMGGGQVAGSPLCPRDAVAAMALVTANVEPNHEMVAFCDKLTAFPVSPKDRLDAVIDRMRRMSFGATDCSLPMVHALENRLDVDMFVVYTDNETWAGRIHPSQALKQYRAACGKPLARSAVVAMVANRFTIADPKDPGMLDVCGFDTSTPQVLSAFAKM